MARTKKNTNLSQQDNNDRAELKRLRDESVVHQLEMAQQVARIRELEAAALATAAAVEVAAQTASAVREQAAEREKTKFTAEIAAKEEQIKNLNAALAARGATAIQAAHALAEQTRVLGGERQEAVATARELTAAEEKLEQCECGRGTWSEPKEGKAGEKWRCKQRSRLRKAGAAFFKDAGSNAKRVASGGIGSAEQSNACARAGVETRAARVEGSGTRGD
jgi:hypothetical protein